jgi:ABC-type proline/glycine betaine transport system substrate-binding protein
MFNMNNKQREIVAILLFLALIAMACLFGSCNVTRTITTTAQTVQKGDTTTVIMTKTIESYDGQVDATKFMKK